MADSSASSQSQGRVLARVVLWAVVIAASSATAFFVAQRQSAQQPARIALVTADGDNYWDLVIAGAQEAADNLGVKLEVIRADGTLRDQNGKIYELLDAGYDGFAVSPVDAVKQGLTLRGVSKTSRLVTLDSDSEFSGRLCFVGADNYAAGRQAGELVKQAIPSGGNVLIVMGPIDKENGERRRQGIIDELLDRSYGPGRPTEPIDEIHSGGTYTVAATLMDEIDPEAATAGVEAYLAENPSVDCIVGIYAYSTPAVLDALSNAEVEGVQVVGFDDKDETIEAIRDGRVFAAIAQDQYNYGVNAIRLLADAAEGKADLAIPITERMHFPPAIVTSENVDAFSGSRRPTDG